MTDSFVYHEDLKSLRNKSPLVVNICNLVSAGFTANVLLAAGASPLMTSWPGELPDIMEKAGALCINVGTLDAPQRELMAKAASIAAEKSIPWALDPAGAAASSYRLECCLELIARFKPSIIKGNAAEIIALANGCAREVRRLSRGVDSLCGADDARRSAELLSCSCGAAVCVSGKEDLLTDGNSFRTLSGGSALMSRVTGMGCAATALSAAFAAVNRYPFEACFNAMALMKNASFAAGHSCEGPGEFAVRFLDEIWMSL